MQEIDIIKHAKNYMDMLSKGVNPITKEKYSANSDINNERLLKCFAFVSEILDRVIISETQKENTPSYINNKSPNGDSQNTTILKDTSDKISQSEKAAHDSSVDTFTNSLVSEDIEGIDVVNTLIQKGLLKQGFFKTNKE